jgi:hypothetical protein
MPVLLKEKRSILFVHIPKCGGTSFLKHMDERGWREIVSVRGTHIGRLGFMRCTPQHMHAELLKRLLRPEEFDQIVTLVRDPLMRLKSEYAWQRDQKITDLNPNDWISHVLSEYQNDPFEYDNHIRPQNEFFLEESNIFKLEENGVKRAVKHVTKKSSEKGLLNKLLGLKNSKNYKLKKTKKSKKIEKAFRSNEMKIKEFYKKDYEILSY